MHFSVTHTHTKRKTTQKQQSAVIPSDRQIQELVAFMFALLHPPAPGLL